MYMVLTRGLVAIRTTTFTTGDRKSGIALRQVMGPGTVTPPPPNQMIQVSNIDKAPP